MESARAAGERERKQGRIHEGNSVTEQTRLAELPDVVNVDLNDDSTDSARLDVRAKHLTEKMEATSKTRSKYKAAPPPAFADLPEFSGKDIAKDIALVLFIAALPTGIINTYLTSGPFYLCRCSASYQDGYAPCAG